MGDDIVTRLVEELDSLKADPQVLRDAIDEIERLRAENADWKHRVMGSTPIDVTITRSDEIELLRAKIERLQVAGDALAEESWNNRSADKAVKAWWEARSG